ncbi:jg6542 [Pararge aegeria aegeria]|uniref:Jg6542 protein n=2 Tax=Pararge aegeria TaxID=116150 RepID=A0A8S4S721_9NEOP|nr:jg6542 [Pararge aegeria aegeria]
MSSVSVTSSKREKTISDLKQEIEAIGALNASLRVYLGNLRTMRKDMRTVNENCKQLVKVNSQWVDTLNFMK